MFTRLKGTTYVFLLGRLAGACFGQAIPSQLLYPISSDLNLSGTSNVVVGSFSARTRADVVIVGFSEGLQSGIRILEVIPVTPDGTLQAPIVQPVSGNPKQIAKGDFNKDGLLDIAVLSDSGDYSSRDLQIFLGNGNGTFRPAIHNSLKDIAPILVAGDFNLDGKTDLVAGTYVLLSNGDGSFRTSQVLGVEVRALADLRGNGVQDLITVGLDPTILTVYSGAGDGTFRATQSVSLPAGIATEVLAADLDGNGSTDLAVSLQGAVSLDQPQPAKPATLAIFPNSGNGNLLAPILLAGYGTPLAASDLNRDGIVDLISGNSILQGLGKNQFVGPSFFRTTNIICSTIISGRTCAVHILGTYPLDLEGSGNTDLVVVSAATGSSQTTVSVLKHSARTVRSNIVGVSAATGSSSLGLSSLVSLYGEGLASDTASSPGPPYPTQLGGARIHIRYTNGSTALAPLLYVSPTQINFSLSTASNPAGVYVPYLPEYGVFTGISVEQVGSVYQETASAFLAFPLAPSLFTVNGSGLVAATAVRVSSSGQQSSVPLITCGAETCNPIPVDLSGDPVYLSLFGTGFEVLETGTGGQIKPIQVSCGGFPALYVGPQSEIPGLDQINVLLGPLPSGMRDMTCVFFSAGTPLVGPIVSNRISLLIK